MLSQSGPWHNKIGKWYVVCVICTGVLVSLFFSITLCKISPFNLITSFQYFLSFFISSVFFLKEGLLLLFLLLSDGENLSLKIALLAAERERFLHVHFGKR